MKSALGRAYCWFWYTTEFWLAPADRRPYTFILRIFYHRNPLLTILIISTLSYCFGRWWLPVTVGVFLFALLILLIGIVLGHLYWTKYTPGEQEHPEYNPGKDGG